MEASYGQFFNAKILLFGEYSLLCGSMALSIPFNRFHGRLVFQMKPTQAEHIKSNEHISHFLSYLLKLQKNGKLAFQLDTDRLKSDLKSGLFFESNIPQGYGLGSSGALVAAIFKTYGEKLKTDQLTTESGLKELKSFFAGLESFFHGKSSGLDPMISFLNQALLISGENTLETIKLDLEATNGKGGVFLIDSGEPGETQPLVKHFREMLKKDAFKKDFDTNFIPLVNNSIHAYTSGETAVLLENLKKLTSFQLLEFRKMIPESVKEIWQNGLDSNQYYLKLCGSGGGGMMLGFTANIEATRKELGSRSLLIIHNF